MSKIRVTKKFHFEMAHALYGYDGICRNIHGHSYVLQVTLLGEPLAKPGHPKDGMVMDFHELKMLIKKNVIEKFDHALVINDQIPADRLEALGSVTEKPCLVPFQPTTENLLIHTMELLRPLLPGNVALHSMRLYETDSSFAEWFASDNS